jgi:hypothetical protein
MCSLGPEADYISGHINMCTPVVFIGPGGVPALRGPVEARVLRGACPPVEAPAERWRRTPLVNAPGSLTPSKGRIGGGVAHQDH